MPSTVGLPDTIAEEQSSSANENDDEVILLTGSKASKKPHVEKKKTEVAIGANALRRFDGLQ